MSIPPTGPGNSAPDPRRSIRQEERAPETPGRTEMQKPGIPYASGVEVVLSQEAQDRQRAAGLERMSPREAAQHILLSGITESVFALLDQAKATEITGALIAVMRGQTPLRTQLWNLLTAKSTEQINAEIVGRITIISPAMGILAQRLIAVLPE